jgi:REP element-mobilizing transposase RayT
MARGDGGKPIFVGKGDHESFLYWLERVCTSHGWRVHAWVLLGNHFHLLLETPEANLVSGMRMLPGTFGKAWNIRRQRQGHVFQGRYKEVPVAGGAAADAHYFKCVVLHSPQSGAGRTGRRGSRQAGVRCADETPDLGEQRVDCRTPRNGAPCVDEPAREPDAQGPEGRQGPEKI